MNWTDERVEQLKKLWADGLSASQIAAQLGGVVELVGTDPGVGRRLEAGAAVGDDQGVDDLVVAGGGALKVRDKPTEKIGFEHL